MLKPQFTKKLLAIVIALGFVIIGGTSLLVLNAIAATPEKATTPVEQVAPQSTELANEAPTDTATKVKFGFIAAAIAVGLGSIGAAIAVGNIGTAAMGTIGEKPELAGSALIFVGLAEGIAIYGLIIAIMILGKL
jgi:V/A-type H+-transporting ATPase subunit K